MEGMGTGFSHLRFTCIVQYLLNEAIGAIYNFYLMHRALVVNGASVSEHVYFLSREKGCPILTWQDMESCWTATISPILIAKHLM